MTEIALRQESSLMPATTSATFERLAGWAQAARGAHEMAVTLVQTSFVPEAFRGKAHEATAAILAGAEIGLDPMAALRSFDIIQGTAAPRANTLRAVVQANGHQMILKESTATRAVVTGCRKGENSWQTSTWTIERATKMGLTGKHNWKVQPQAMLVARATSECARLIASDAILGIPYSSEELDDDGTMTVAGLVESKPPRKTAQRAVRPAPEPVEEPSFDEPEEGEIVEMITKAQQPKLHASLSELGLGDRDAGLREISRILGRTVESTTHLTKADAMAIIDDLSSQIAAKNAPAEPAFDDPWPETAVVPDAEQ